jgi:hypothetical protein
MSWYDNGMPIINAAEVLATAELIKQLLASPEGGNGGPLHVIVIDGNTGDEHVHDSSFFGHADGRQIETYLCKPDKGTWVGSAYHHAYLDELGVSQETADLCRLILASFRRMPEPWRAAAIAWADGTIAENLPWFVRYPDATSVASPEQVEALVAELREEIARGDALPEPKPCAPIPCPPFQSVAIQGVERTRYEQNIDRPGVRVTRLDDDGCPIGEPVEVSDWAQVGIKLDEPERGGPVLRWVESTVRFDNLDPDLWQVLYNWEKPNVDMQQVLNEPPQVKLPTFVQVPEDSSIDAVAKALSLCRRLGVLKEGPAGTVIVPHGIELDGGGYFLAPPGTDTP